MRNFKFQNGISMVEVLVALVISLFLLGGIIQVYIANKASYSFSNAISRIQENGRYSIDTMAQELRMAGFTGCAVTDPDDEAAMDSLVNNLNPAGAGFDAVGGDILSKPPLEGGVENGGLNGSDSFTLRGPEPSNINVLPPYGSTSAQIFVTQPHGLQDDDIVVISNCRGADLFQISNISTSNGTLVHNTGVGSPGNYNPDNCVGGNAHCLSQTYGADATVYKIQEVIYSIAPGASGEPALWKSVKGVNLELVEGIEQMQLLYGVDTNGDQHPNQYMTGDLISDVKTDPINWYDVMSVRLMLLVRSESAFVVEAPQTLTYNGATANAPDRRLRQVFTTTIALRNRVSDT